MWFSNYGPWTKGVPRWFAGVRVYVLNIVINTVFGQRLLFDECVGTNYYLLCLQLCLETIGVPDPKGLGTTGQYCPRLHCYAKNLTGRFCIGSF